MAVLSFQDTIPAVISSVWGVGPQFSAMLLEQPLSRKTADTKPAAADLQPEGGGCWLVCTWAAGKHLLMLVSVLLSAALAVPALTSAPEHCSPVLTSPAAAAEVWGTQPALAASLSASWDCILDFVFFFFICPLSFVLLLLRLGFLGFFFLSIPKVSYTGERVTDTAFSVH